MEEAKRAGKEEEEGRVYKGTSTQKGEVEAGMVETRKETQVLPEG